MTIATAKPDKTPQERRVSGLLQVKVTFSHIDRALDRLSAMMHSKYPDSIVAQQVDVVAKLSHDLELALSDLRGRILEAE